MAFQKRIIPGFKEFKSWISNTFSTKTHGHSEFDQIQSIQESVDALKISANSMPDFKRTIQITRVAINTYNVIPGTIFKVNVPGYLSEQTTKGYHGSSESDSVDLYYKIAADPAYLYRHTSNASNYANYPRPSYNNFRCSFGGSGICSNELRSFVYTPIFPGEHTYVAICDITSDASTRICFTPCVMVPTNIDPKDYITAVGRTENHLSTDGRIGTLQDICSEVFDGSWLNLFNADYSIKPVQMFDTEFRLMGSFWNKERFHTIDPFVRDNRQMWWRASGTVHIRYFSSEEVDSIIANLSSSEKSTVLNSGLTAEDQAELMRDKFCAIHNSFNTYTSLNKLKYTYLIARDNNVLHSGGVDEIDTTKYENGTKLWYYTHNFYKATHYCNVEKINLNTGYWIDSTSGLDTTTTYSY